MSVIKTHDVTLRGKSDASVVLRPLSDEHLPLLYRWNSDLEVLFWCEGDDITEPYDCETVHDIYGRTSRDAFCFLIEKNGVPVGECWLQKMNLPEVNALYPKHTDVRRIDMSLGEKDCWGKGIGTEAFKLLMDFAFNGEKTDVLHCLIYDHNVRSRRMLEKCGFMFHHQTLEKHEKSEYEVHYTLTRRQYFQSIGTVPPAKER